MNMFANLTTDDSIASEKDSVGGGSGPLNSGLYPMTIAMAYIGESKGGAMSLNLSLKTEDGKEVRQTLYMTSGRAKGSKNYYEKDGVKNYLPGFLLANSLCQLAAGLDVAQTDVQEKVINLYSFDARAEVPTKVKVVMDLLNKPILVGMIKQTVDKNVETTQGSGVYVPSGETREENEMDKVFHAESRLTTAEIKAKATEPAFVNTWTAKHTGVTRNKSTGAAAGGVAGAPRPAGAAPAVAKPKSSLFA